MRIAILGWGSLIWDKHPEFDEQHEDWLFDGPSLKLEFSRVSKTRSGALTLVLDAQHGAPCKVAYALSKRKNPDDAVCDLRCREGTVLRNIGFCFRDGSRKQSRDKETFDSIRAWANEKQIDVAVWADLESNFEAFSVENALLHIQTLDSKGKAAASEYVWRAPEFVSTPLRKALQLQPWFPNAR